MLSESIKNKLYQARDRYQELTGLLSDPDVINNQERFKAYSKEHAQLHSMVEAFDQYLDYEKQLQEAQAMLNDESDDSLQAMARDEVNELEQKLNDLQDQLQNLMLPKDPNDDKNVYLEIRAGTGGDEAALFASDLARMYGRYADSQGWQLDVVNQQDSEKGGYKEIIMKLSGKQVYATLKFESGVHRVQRVPETETQGRVHTSACTVAVMPEADEIQDVELDSNELKVDTFRASGAGGQHVNTTDSAIRITHLPTGTVVECQDERSQHKNRAKAMQVLQAKLLAAKQQAQAQEQAQARKSLVGGGDRSERIRTYNFPQGRLTDHRINLTIYQLDSVMEGQLDQVIEPLQQEHHAQLLVEAQMS